jgi:hypothetical protein
MTTKESIDRFIEPPANLSDEERQVWTEFYEMFSQNTR